MVDSDQTGVVSWLLRNRNGLNSRPGKRKQKPGRLLLQGSGSGSTSWNRIDERTWVSWIMRCASPV